MKRKFTKLMAAFALLVFMTPTMAGWGQTRTTEEVYSTCLFGKDYDNNTTVNDYQSTWTATNGNFSWAIVNGNAGYQGGSNPSWWGYVKFGRKSDASVGNIITQTAYNEAITKVELTIDAILDATKVNSIKLYTSSNNSSWAEVGSFDIATGTKTVTLANPAANLYYKIEFNCQAHGSKNGIIQVSKVEYYHNTGGPTTYTVTYNANNGATPVPTYADGGHPAGTYTVLANTNSNLGFTKTGHYFTRWNTKADGTGTYYDPADNTHNTINLSSDVTLYAQWTPTIHDVTLPSNNEYGTYGLSYTYNSSTVTSPDHIPYGVEVTLTYTPAPAYEGYTATWSVNGTALSGNKFTMPDENVTVTVAVANRKTATYTIASTSSVTASGTTPSNSSASFSQTYGTACQMTSGNSMKLTLSGYQGQIIKKITLSMKSNQSGGAGNMSAKAGTTTLASIATAAFNTSSWYGAWSTTYVDIIPTMSNSNYVIKSGETVEISIAATANSLYCQSFTIEYEPSTDPLVNVTPASREVDYQAHNSATESLNFTVSSENITSPAYILVYCDENGNVLSSTPDWFSATLSGTTVSFTTTPNTGGDRTAYFKVYATVDSAPIYSGLCSVTQLHELHTYSMVSSSSDLEAGAHYIIVGIYSNPTSTDTYYFAMGAQNGDLRSVVAVEYNSSTDVITEATGVREFVFSGDATNKWTIYDKKHPGFLCATSSGDKKIGTRELNSDGNSQWTISFNDNHAATIVAQGDKTDNIMKFNYNNGSNMRFSCYSSNSSLDALVYLFKRVDNTDYEFYSNTTSSAAIASGETYTVHSPATLTLNAANNGTLIIEDGGQLITNAVVAATVKKNITAYTSADDGWNLISSPVNVNLGAAGIGLITETTYDLYYLNEGSKKWINFKANEGNTNPGFNIEPQKGYLYANAANTTLSFSGNLQPNSSIGCEVSLTKAGEGWNLVGNPYPFNAYVDKSYYVINGRTVEAYEGSDPVPTCTGIIVKATAANEKVTFRRTAFTSGTINNGNIELVLAQQATNRGNASTLDNAIVSFNEGNELPKFYFGEQNANLYIPQGTEEYAIVSSNGQGTMPVNFRANENGQYTLTVNPENVEMNYLHLIDNMTGTDIDLLATPSYTFNAKTTDYESRFKLVFASANGNADGSNETFAFFSNGQLIVSNEGEATLQVVDMLGRIVSSETVNGSVSKAINQPAGIYMIRLVNGENVRTQKIIVK